MYRYKHIIYINIKHLTTITLKVTLGRETIISQCFESIYQREIMECSYCSLCTWRGKTNYLCTSKVFCAIWWLEEVVGRETQAMLCDLTAVMCLLLEKTVSFAVCPLAWIYCYNKQIISPEHPSNVAFFRGSEWGKLRLCQDPDRDC